MTISAESCGDQKAGVALCFACHLCFRLESELFPTESSKHELEGHQESGPPGCDMLRGLGFRAKCSVPWDLGNCGTVAHFRPLNCQPSGHVVNKGI